MGKRNKTGIMNSESTKSKNKKQKCEDIDTNTEINSKLVHLDIPLQDKKIKSKKKNKAHANNDDTGINNSVLFVNDNITAAKVELAESITPPVKNKKVKSKNKKRGDVNHDDQETTEVTFKESIAEKPEEIFTTSSEKVKTKKRHKTHLDSDDSENNKKIKPTDNGAIEVNNQRKKNDALSQEDDVKDEDIDKFCDEINEEDNALYESWVELLEAKLNSNKKKPK